MTGELSTKAATTSTQAISDRTVVAGLHGIGVVLLALWLYVRTLLPTPEPIPTPADAEASWWGLWPVTYVPSFWFWLGIVLVLATMAWSWRVLLSGASPRPASSSATLQWLYAISALLLVAFYAFPIAHTRWGDAYILSQAIAWPDPALRLTHSWQAPLDVFLHSQLWLALGPQNGWQDATPVYRLLSPIAGAIYLAVLLQLAADRDLAPSWFTFGLLASLGLLQLFFGYIENYAFAAAGIVAFLWLGRRVLQGRTPLWLAVLTLGLTNGIHPSTIILGPALLYLGGLHGGREPQPFCASLWKLLFHCCWWLGALWR